MNRTSLTSTEIIKLLTILIGTTEPCGDSRWDEEINENLTTLIDIIDWCVDELYFAASHRHSPYMSMRDVAERAYTEMFELTNMFKDRMTEIG